MTLFGLSIIDIAVIFVYFGWIFWIGYKAMKNIHVQEDFFLGGRTFGRLITTFAMFGQGTSAESAVGSTTQVKQMGISGITWSVLPNFIWLPVYFFAAVWYRRLRLLTMTAYYVYRYKSRRMGAVYSVAQAFFFMVIISIGFLAMCKTVMAITPKDYEDMTPAQQQEYEKAQRLNELETADYSLLSEQERSELEELRLLNPEGYFSYFSKFWLTVILAIVIVAYSICGGLEAAAKSDVLQSILTLVLTVLFLPFGFMRINETYGSSGVIGVFETMHKVLPEMVFDLFGSPATAEMTWYLMVVMGISVLPNILCQANNMLISSAARDDWSARTGFVDGMLIKRFATVLWGLVAMVILVLYYADTSDPDLLWGKATRDLLGSLNIGLVGLMIACLMSALMSCADAHMLTVSSLLTDGFYKYVFPDRSEKHYVFVGRIFCGVYIIGGVTLALYSSDIWSAFKYLFTLNFAFAAPFLLGILWRRANTKAAWATIIFSGSLTFLLPLAAPLIGMNRWEPLLKVNHSQKLTRTYTASSIDVADREQEISRWQQLSAQGLTEEPRPESIVEGEPFEKVFASKERAIFWDNVEAFRNEQGEVVRSGRGMLKAEMLLLYCVGVPLEKLSFPMLETLRYLSQFIISFGIFIIVALLTKPMAREFLDEFYGRLRTPSYADREKDAQELAKTQADTSRFNHRKLFPNSSWEFNRWTRHERTVVIKILGWVMLIYVALFAIVTIGS
jgi:solute:Na+ symporter, SSS family